MVADEMGNVTIISFEASKNEQQYKDLKEKAKAARRQPPRQRLRVGHRRFINSRWGAH